MAFRVFCGILALSLGRFALAYNSPPTGAITVGSGGTYATISAALKDTSSSVYFVYAGTYAEQVYITRANVKIYGQTKYSHTYTGNRGCFPLPSNLPLPNRIMTEVTITHTENSTTAGGDDPSGTVRVHATNVALYNLNIANPFGNAQAHSCVKTRV
jgi:pectinesterase